MPRLGFTGTQVGMTARQSAAVYDWVREFLKDNEITEVHHGDCIGADAQFIELLPAGPWEIVCHPPINPSKRAWVGGDIIWPEKDYSDRNNDIVTCCDILLVAPQQSREILRSGTWMTYRIAGRQKRRRVIFWPGGRVE